MVSLVVVILGYCLWAGFDFGSATGVNVRTYIAVTLATVAVPLVFYRFVDANKIEIFKAHRLILGGKPKSVNVDTERFAGLVACMSGAIGLGYVIAVLEQPLDLVLIPFGIFVSVLGFGSLMLFVAAVFRQVARLFHRRPSRNNLSYP